MRTSNLRRALLPLVVATVANPLAAQQQATTPVDPRWLPFLGCWSTAPIGNNSALLCVTATSSPTVVQLATVVGDSVTATERLDASGERVSFVADGCTGWQSTRWSRNERRFFLSASFTCADGVPQSSSGIVSMKAADAFARVEAVERASYRAVRTATFDAANNTPVAPETRQGRARAAARVTPADIIEASSILPAPVVDAWLADYAQTVDVTMADLREMRKARVPASSIDMMIAISNPDAFRVATADVSVGRAGARALAGGASGWEYGITPDMSLHFLGRASYRLSAWNRWSGFSPDNWFAGGQQFTIIPQAQAPARSSGSVLWGQGYLSGSGTQSGMASPRSDPSTGGAGSGSGQSGGGGGRTAQPRP